MTFSEIIKDIDRRVNTDTSSYSLVDKADVVNKYLSEVVSVILNCNGKWEFDDSNYTDLPIGATTMIDSQQDYNIAGSTFLDITRVAVKDVNGKYQLLEPITQSDIKNQSMTEFEGTAGMPKYYDKLGDSIFLYPKPSSSLTTLSAGLKVYFQRVPSYFVSGDTTKTPGFNPLFHQILSVGASLDYAENNEMINKVNIFTNKLEKLKAGLVEAYSSRSRDEKIRMRVGRENFGQDTSSVGNNFKSDLQI
jgi:hypothetical protein